MAQTGPKPKPTVLKKLAGNPGKRPLNAREPQPGPPASTRCPRNLSKDAAAFWRHHVEWMTSIGLLTEADLPALLLMAEHFSIARQAAREISSQGLVAPDENSAPRKHPLLQVLRDSSAAFRAYAVEFGMTPSARSRIQLSLPEKELTLEEQLRELMAGIPPLEDRSDVGD